MHNSEKLVWDNFLKSTDVSWSTISCNSHTVQETVEYFVVSQLASTARRVVAWTKSHREVLLSYLPLSHIAAQMCDIWTSIIAGNTVYFAHSDVLKVRGVRASAYRVRWRTGRETSFSSPCSNLRSFESKCIVLKKVLATLLVLFGTSQWIVARNIVPLSLRPWVCAMPSLASWLRSRPKLDACLFWHFYFSQLLFKLFFVVAAFDKVWHRFFVMYKPFVFVTVEILAV